MNDYRPGTIHILMVDDEPDMQRLFQLREPKIPYRWEYCRSGEDGVAMLQFKTFDIFLVDLRMPDMDGLTFIKHVFAHTDDCLCVVVTAITDMATVREAMNIGAFDFICKPFEFNDILATIDKAARVLTARRTAQAVHASIVSQNNLLRKAVDTIEHIGVVISDADGCIQYINLAEAQRHGYAIDELLGRSAAILGIPSRALADVPASDVETWERESLNIDRHGHIFPIYLFSRQLYTDDRFIGRVTISEDRTEHHAILKMLQSSQARTDELSSALNIITTQREHATQRKTEWFTTHNET